MKNFTYLFFLLSFGSISLTSCSKDSLEEIETAELKTAIPTISYSPIEAEVLALINDYRAEKGLSQLNFIDEISHQAALHNHHMILADEVCHDQFGSRYSALVNSVGAKAVSENVAFGYRTAEAVVEAWLKSDGHRKNIEGDHTHFGISVEKDEAGKLYFTNIFIRK